MSSRGVYRFPPNVFRLHSIHLHMMAPKRVLITYGVDVDAVAGWLGSYGGQDSTNDISRGKSSVDDGRTSL